MVVSKNPVPKQYATVAESTTRALPFPESTARRRARAVLAGDVLKQIAEITSLIKESSNRVQGIAQLIEQVTAGSEEMSSRSEQLGAQANALREPVARFKTDNSRSANRQTVTV